MNHHCTPARTADQVDRDLAAVRQIGRLEMKGRGRVAPRTALRMRSLLAELEAISTIASASSGVIAFTASKGRT